MKISKKTYKVLIVFTQMNDVKWIKMKETSPKE